MEVMIALMVMAVGALGSMAVNSTAISANQNASYLSRSRGLAEQEMEDLLSLDVSTAEAHAGAIPDMRVIPEGVRYHREYSVVPVEGQEDLVLITVRCWYGQNGNENDPRGVEIQMLRTRSALHVKSYQQVD